LKGAFRSDTFERFRAMVRRVLVNTDDGGLWRLIMVESLWHALASGAAKIEGEGRTRHVVFHVAPPIITLDPSQYWVIE